MASLFDFFDVEYFRHQLGGPCFCCFFCRTFAQNAKMARQIIGDDLNTPPRSLTFSPHKNGAWKTILSYWEGNF